MASVLDVAAYILNKRGSMTAMKLQKLVYYAQVWSLVWDEEALFRSKIETWANGPVCPALYREHRGMFRVHKGTFVGANTRAFTHDQRETMDIVLKHYGKRSSVWLSELTHLEKPWLDARKGLEPGERGSNEITRAAMAEYYESL